VGSPKFVLPRDGGWTADLFLDDFLMVLKTSQGVGLKQAPDGAHLGEEQNGSIGAYKA
jgi:hypothetical protein